MFQSLEYKHPKFYQVFRLFIVFFASLLYAWNLRCFAKTAGLFPGGFSGLSLLLQQIGLDFIHVSIPFSVFNIGLNLVPTYIAYKFIGKKFTLYSIIVIVLTSIFTDMLPAYVFTKDVLLISVFGGLINGFAISLCLNVGTTTGGTDFISRLMANPLISTPNTLISSTSFVNTYAGSISVKILVSTITIIEYRVNFFPINLYAM
jgi:uncharacterized membrane-anchored protein YitT (DUF2179 family)